MELKQKIKYNAKLRGNLHLESSTEKGNREPSNCLVGTVTATGNLCIFKAILKSEANTRRVQ